MAESAWKKRSFDATFKLKVTNYAEQNTNRAAARKYGVDEKWVREWKKQKNKLRSLHGKRRWLEGGGRKAAFPDVEEQLAAWIDYLRSNNIRITRGNVHNKALQLAQEREIDEFCASRGWLDKFFGRNNFSLHRQTTVGQKLPQDLANKVTRFIITTKTLRQRNQYPLSYIGNMDKTPLWLDMPGETTITRTGQKSVPVHTTGHDKGRFTVVLAAMADGRKLNPFVVFKGVCHMQQLTNTRGVVVAMSRNGWMNKEVTKDWVKQVWALLTLDTGC